MKRLAVTEIDILGTIVSLVCEIPIFWENILPKVGTTLFSFEDQTNNLKLNDAIEEVNKTGLPKSLNISLPTYSINCIAIKHLPNTIDICWEITGAFESDILIKDKVNTLPVYTSHNMGDHTTNSNDTTINLKRFTDNLPLVVFEINLFPDGRFEFGFINKEMESFFPGFSKEAVNADNSLLFVRVHPEDKQKLMDSIRDVFKFYIWDIEYRVFEKGEIKWVKGYGRPEMRAGYITVCTYLQDITKLKKNEEDLEREHKLLRTLIDNLPVSIFVKDSNGRKIVANKLDVDYMGLKYEQEALGKTDKEIFGNKGGNGGYLQDIKILNTGVSVIDEEGQLHYKNGNKRDILVSKIPLLNELGQTTGLIGICRDITNFKKQEEQYKLVDYAFRNAEIPMYFLKKDGSIYDFNEAICNKLGYSKDEFSKLTVFNTSTRHTLESWKNRWKELKKRNTKTVSTKLRKKDNTLVDVEIKSNIFNYKGTDLTFTSFIDVTEKKKLEKELHLVGFSFRKSNVPMSFITEDGSLYDFNDATCTLLGYTREEYKELKILAINPTFNLENWSERWKDIKTNGGAPFYTSLMKKDGTLIEVEEWANIILYETIEINCVTYIDVTEIKKSNEALQRSIERFEYATIATDDVIWEADLVEKNVYFTKNFTTLFGHPSGLYESMNNNVWLRYVHPNDLPIVLAETEKMIDWGNGKWRKEYRLRKADGEYATILDNGFVVKNKEGKAIKLIGTLRDITIRRKEEERLKLLEKVVTETSQSIVIAEAKTGNDTPIIYANASFTRITGFKLEEITGKNPRFLHNGLDTKDDEGRRIMRNAIKNYLPWKVEVINTKKNGENYWAEVSGFPVYDANLGKYTHWVAIQTDITSRKEAEEEKEHLVKELVENNKELKQFGYITTHNLRAPLTNLVSISNLIDINNINDQRTKKLINGFKLSTMLLNDTLDDLIKVLFIKENSNLIKVDLVFNEVLEKVKQSIASILLLNAVKIEADFSSCKSVSFVYIYLESIFLNLMTNAVKYSHPARHPIITIKSRKEADGHITLSFKDNGIGMNIERVKNKIFGLYQRFHNNPDGKGIGLYLVQSQISALGGSIEVESKENVGTTFTIHFK